MSSRPWPHAILFDMDGLLLDSESVWGLAEADLARRLGAPWSVADAQACIGIGLRETVVRIAHRAGLRADVDVLLSELVEHFLARCGDVRPKRGAAAILDAAASRAVPVAVATSSPRRVAERALLGAGLLDRFTVIAGGDEVAAPKPDPAVFVLAATRLGVRPDESLVLEDSVTGCRAGRLSGARVFAVPETHVVDHAPYEALADAIFADLHEVRRRLGW